MLNRKLSSQTGLSLVELMVGMAVALIVLSGLSAVYLNTSRSSRITTTATQLNQDVRAVMDIIVNDMRRAGFWATATSGANPFSDTATVIQIATGGSCVLYSYDATFAGGTAGVADSADFFGFRLSAGGVVQTLLPNGTLVSTDTTTTCSTDNLWENLTDPRAVTVTALTFNTVGSKCIAYSPSNYVSTNTATFDAWTTDGTTPTCSQAAWTVSVPPPLSGATYPAATKTFVETRQVNITLTAQSKTDTTLTRTLSETVLVRNNRVMAPP